MNDEKKFKKFLSKVDKKRRKKLGELLYEDDWWQRFKQEPASHKYHGSFPGGLLKHSLLVTRTLFRTSKAVAPKRWPDSSLALVGLFHDFGKLGNDNQSLYVLKQDKDGKDFYEINPDVLVLPHSVRSVKILSDYGVKLNEEEYQAILYHGGLFYPSGKEIVGSYLSLTVMLHFSDMWASNVLNR